MYAGACIVFVALTVLSSPTARADYFDDVANSGRCWSHCDIPLAPDTNYYVEPLPSIGELYAPIQDLIREFAPYTGIGQAFLQLPVPADAAEMDQRVTDFFASAYRENDYVKQAIDFLRTKVTEIEYWIADDQAYIQVNRDLPASLQPQVDALQAELTQKTMELARWRDHVARLQSAERNYSAAAQQARSDVVTLFQAISPSDRLLISGEKVEAAESLETQYPPRPLEILPLSPAGPTAPSAAETDPWRPVERSLGLDLGASTAQKVEWVRQLVPEMAQNVQICDAAIADLKAKRALAGSVDSERNLLEQTVTSLRANIDAIPQVILDTVQQTREARDDYLSSRDQLTLRAVQSWLWTNTRDNIVIPEVKEFLIANGIDQLAAKLDAAPLAEIIQEARNIKWSSMWYYSGVDEFMAVQEKVVGLLNPAQSAILQSAEFNALPSTEQAARFSQDVFQQLGNDGVDLFNAAGQVSVSEPYRKLLSELMGDMPPRRSADDL